MGKVKDAESFRPVRKCSGCGIIKKIKATTKNLCQNCWHKHKYRTQPEFFLRYRYSQIKQRCTNPKNQCYDLYKGKLDCTLDEFLKLFLKCSNFKKLYKEWQKSSFNYKVIPSIDRIDKNGRYSIDNMQILTHSQNCSKDQETVSIVQLTKNGEYIQEFSKGVDAASILNIHWANIWKVCNGKRKTAGGFKFMYKEDYENL